MVFEIVSQNKSKKKEKNVRLDARPRKTNMTVFHQKTNGLKKVWSQKLDAGRCLRERFLSYVWIPSKQIFLEVWIPCLQRDFTLLSFSSVRIADRKTIAISVEFCAISWFLAINCCLFVRGCLWRDRAGFVASISSTESSDYNISSRGLWV